MDADQSLLDLVFDRLADDKVPDEVATLVLAAYTPASTNCARLWWAKALTCRHQRSCTPNRMEPIYVTAITVARVPRHWHVGQPPVVITRRPDDRDGSHGSGKSSFAETAQLALTRISIQLFRP